MPPRSNKMAVDSAANDYELQREQNIQANQQMLEKLMGMQIKVSGGDALAISALGAPAPKRKKTVAKPKVKKEPKAKKEEEGEGNENVPAERPVLGTRRSARNAGKPLTSYAGDGENIVDRMKMPIIVSRPNRRWDEDDSGDEEDRDRGGDSGGARVNRLVGRKHDPKTFGLIPDVRIGTWWATRAECSSAAIHAPFVAGISGGLEGAYSVALSGGYDDDVDMGEAFTYTGSGGRDLKGTKANPKNLRTAPQSSHQTFENSFNRSLQVSADTKKPVRVIRGFKLPGKYAPKDGYRYDGIYIVERAWIAPGNNPGRFNVCKFAFRRVPGQPPIPERSDDTDEDEEEVEEDEDEDVKMEDVKDEDAQTESASEDPKSEDMKEEEEEEETKVPAKRGKFTKTKAAKSEPASDPPKGRSKTTRSTRTNKA
ncbi:hypothetical protein BDV93DRAFT_527279 [Ceratobasidium sp. AG-I]|nr:hypothetical protein BDV93DRAFT_527279 [Ceratobasidium sp. AG-I]